MPYGGLSPEPFCDFRRDTLNPFQSVTAIRKLLDTVAPNDTVNVGQHHIKPFPFGNPVSLTGQLDA